MDSFNEEDLLRFLQREKIIGYDEEIISILNSKPNEEVISDLKDSFIERDNIKLNKTEIKTMGVYNMLDRYLQWNGIYGYTESIISVSKNNPYILNNENRSIVKWKDKYYYRPNEGDNIVWVWDNEELEGLPIMIKISEIYGRDFYLKEFNKKERLVNK